MDNPTTTAKPNHAEQNATAWMGQMSEMLDRLTIADCPHKDYEAKDGGPNVCDACEAKLDDDGCAIETIDADNARDAIIESPLSVGVRASGFHAVGETPEPDEFEILLTTGGPALRIIGNLDRYNQPVSCRLEYQDWGTPWTYFAGFSDESRAILQPFAECFYFGEG